MQIKGGSMLYIHTIFAAHTIFAVHTILCNMYMHMHMHMCKLKAIFIGRNPVCGL